jgi:hypothetical protein
MGEGERYLYPSPKNYPLAVKSRKLRKNPPDTPESPKLAVRFKSSRYSRHFFGIFGKSGISGKFPGISEASLDSTSHLGEKAITFYSGLRIQ